MKTHRWYIGGLHFIVENERPKLDADDNMEDYVIRSEASVRTALSNWLDAIFHIPPAERDEPEV